MRHEIIAASSDFMTALVPLCVEHERIVADVAAAQSATIARYANAAIRAVENYLDKDVEPVTHKYYDGVLFPLVFTRGLIRSCKLQALDDSDPPVLVDVGTQPRMNGRTDFKSGGTDIGVVDASGTAYPPYTVAGGGVLVIESGFAAFADLPGDVVEFMLAVFGAHWEVRESSNYSAMVFNVDNYPKYLLDPYRTLSYA